MHNEDLPHAYPTLPQVSLLIAMRNEEKFIENCIKSILFQDYPSHLLEVFFLDGKSTDDSRNKVEQLIKGRSNFFLLSNPGVTQSAGWNIGIRESKGDVIGIVGAHSELEPNYVSEAIRTLHRTGADMVGGPMRAIGLDNVSKAIAAATSTPFGVGGAKFHYAQKEEEVDTVYMGFCARSTYAAIGGFDEEMIRNQDDELSYRLTETGGKIVCNPGIISKYYNRSSLGKLLQQYFQYGYWKVRVLQKHSRQMRPRHFVPAVFVLALIGSAALTFTSSGGVLAFAIVIVAYGLANISASLSTAAKTRFRYLVLLPVAFATLHVSYGLGFLVGLFKFWNRWRDRSGKVPQLRLDQECTGIA